MEIFIKILQFIVSFSLLVFVHEFGHFITARMCKIRVDKFYIFFNPWFSLFKFKKGDTEYGIGWLPFGGYCKIAGMIDESMDTEQMKQPPQPYEFRSKPAWQRLIIMLGGVIMNVITAIVIYIGICFSWGDSYIASKDVTWGYTFSAMAQEIGFENGDKILTINGTAIENSDDILGEIVLADTPDVAVGVERNGEMATVTVSEANRKRMMEEKEFMSYRIPFIISRTEPGMPADKAGLQPGDRLVAAGGDTLIYFDEYKAVFNANKGKQVALVIARDSAGVKQYVNTSLIVSDEGLIGVAPQAPDELFTVQYVDYNIFQAIPAGFHRTGEVLGSYVKQLRHISPKHLGGFISIGSIFPSAWSWFSFWQLTAFLSIILAVMNILPIPALDGGHVMFLLYEAVTGRKPGDKFMERAQIVGLILLFGLLLFANGNDIYKLFK